MGSADIRFCNQRKFMGPNCTMYIYSERSRKSHPPTSGLYISIGKLTKPSFEWVENGAPYGVQSIRTAKNNHIESDRAHQYAVRNI